jgi:septum site-determining protein MinD
MGKSIGMVSLKGGVGKTSSTLSLGKAIANLGKKVLLVDANFSAPNLGMHLKLIEPEVTLHHVLGRKNELIEAIQTVDNFDILPSSLFSEIKINPLKLKERLKSIKKNYDFILIDSSPSLNDESLSTIFASDELFVVSTPDYPTLSTTIKAIKVAKRHGTNVSGIILNKVYGKNFEISPLDIEKTAEVPVMAVIPYDTGFLKAVYNFRSFLEHSPNSIGGKEYRKLAEIITGEKNKRFISFVDLFRSFPKLQDINREIYYERIFG